MAVRFLLDAPSLVYRAFFALPKTITDSRGSPVNAVRGFTEMITRLLMDHRPDGIVAVFDNDWRPAFRVAAYPGYKADRPDEPVELGPQFDVVAGVLDAAGIVRAEAEGLEADDVIATLIERKPREEETVIVTGDRDLLCLVRDPDVRLLFTLRGVKSLKTFDERTVEDDYGIPPRLYSDFATLRGDPSDGLPGVKGVGPKRAAELLRRYGSLDAVVDHAGELGTRLQTAFEEAHDYLEAMDRVVPLVRDADVMSSEPHEPDEDALRRLREDHNLGSTVPRLLQALRGER